MASLLSIQIKDHINKNVKFREHFRPFTAAIIQEFADEYFNIDQKSEYILVVFDVKPKMKKHISATVHVDNTCEFRQ